MTASRRRCREAAPAARRPADEQRGAGRLGAAGAGADVQGRRDRGRNPASAAPARRRSPRSSTSLRTTFKRAARARSPPTSRQAAQRISAREEAAGAVTSREARTAPALQPLGLLAELTHRCPLGCPYCSNPLALEPRATSSTPRPGAGVRRSGGARRAAGASLRRRAGARRDLVEIAARARGRALHQSHHLGRRHHHAHLRDLWEAGLDHVQLSIQDAEAVRPTASPAIAARSSASTRSRREAVRLGLPLTVNVVVHRANIERISRHGRSGAEARRHAGSRSRMCSITAGR